MDTYKYLKNFNSIQRTPQKLRFVLFCITVYGINIPYLCKLCNYIGKVNWVHFRELVIPLSKISLPHHWPFRNEGLFNSELFLTNFRCNIFWSTNTMESVRPVFQSLFEDTIITTNFLKSHICSTSCIEIHTLFAIFNNKELGHFKVRSTHSILKGVDDGKSFQI